MVNAGELTELINAVKVTLTNFTDTLDFGQLFNIRWRSFTPQNKKPRGDGTVEFLDGTPELSIEADIFLTTPEITTFIGYTKPTGTPPQLSLKNWDLKTTGFDAATDTIRILGKVNGLEMIAGETGDANVHLTITAADGVITEV